LFYGVFVRFSTRGVQKHQHHKSLWGKAHVKNFLPKTKKIEEKNHFVSFFPFSFLSRFLALFLCMRSSKTPHIYFKAGPEGLKKNSKKGRRQAGIGPSLLFYILLFVPCQSLYTVYSTPINDKIRDTPQEHAASRT
jgi:hypothetical protein